MDITKVRLLPPGRKNNRVLARAELTIGDDLVIHDIKVIEGRDGVFVAMPSRLGNDGIFRDVVHPLSRDAREKIDELVLGEYYRTRK